MSLESMAVVWAHSEATGATLLGLLAIADHDTDAGAWPAMETIAQRARVSREAARKIVRKLEDMGEIVTDQNGGGGLRTQKHMRTNRYEIMLNCPPSCDGSARHRKLSPEATEAKILDGIGRAEPVDNTPPTAGGVPAGGRGAPPTAGGANLKKTTHLGNSEPKSNNQSTPDRENEEDIQPVDDYTNWHPGQLVAKTAAVLNSGGILTEAEAKKFTDLVDVPPPPTKTPPHPEPVSAEQQALNDDAEKLQCPKGFGSGKFTRHWIPGITSCATCGEEAATILDHVQQLEVTP